MRRYAWDKSSSGVACSMNYRLHCKPVGAGTATEACAIQAENKTAGKKQESAQESPKLATEGIAKPAYSQACESADLELHIHNSSAHSWQQDL